MLYKRPIILHRSNADMCAACCFFFSSRRRHTRFDCDWSSDVCSSDLDVFTLIDPQSDGMLRLVAEAEQGSEHPLAAAIVEGAKARGVALNVSPERFTARSEEHTSELQSQSNLVCRLLLEKKN